MVEFPPLSPEDLIQLGADFLRVDSVLRQEGWIFSGITGKTAPSVSDLVSRGTASPTGLSSVEAAAMVAIFRNEVPYPH